VLASLLSNHNELFNGEHWACTHIENCTLN
jgi:hypothetical protein